MGVQALPGDAFPEKEAAAGNSRHYPPRASSPRVLLQASHMNVESRLGVELELRPALKMPRHCGTSPSPVANDEVSSTYVWTRWDPMVRDVREQHSAPTRRFLEPEAEGTSKEQLQSCSRAMGDTQLLALGQSKVPPRRARGR